MAKWVEEHKRSLESEREAMMRERQKLNGEKQGYSKMCTQLEQEKKQLKELRLEEHSWIDRFDHFAEINSVSENSKKSLFITSLSSEAYELLKNLCAPSSLSTKLFTDLVKIMKDHLKPAPSIITERYKFKECRQLHDQDVKSYVTALKKLSMHCDFAESLESNIRDQFVWGLKSGAMKKRLLAETNLTYTRAIKIATSLESAAKDVLKMENSAIQKLEPTNFNYINRKRKNSTKFNRKCFCCGIDNHVLSECRYGNKKKNFMSHNAEGQIYIEDLDLSGDLEKLFCVDECNDIKASKDSLSSNNILYQGDRMKPLGTINVKVDVCGNEYNLKLFVSNEEGKRVKIVKEFQAVFSETLGKDNKKTFKLELKDDVTPVCCKPRPLPYFLKEKVELEIKRLVNMNILNPVTNSEWATLIVPVMKSNGQIRICGNYNITLNPNLKKNKHPIPRVMDLFANFKEATCFLKIDLDTPGLFQAELENVLMSIEGIAIFYDDIVIWGETPEMHEKRLKSALERLKDCGLTVKAEKCQLYAQEVEFLGYTLSEDGVGISDNITSAIKKIPVPKNQTDLRSFLGMRKEHQVAFDRVKACLRSHEVLTHYDPSLSVKVTCDASPYGVGAVIAHVVEKEERPIAFASRESTIKQLSFFQECVAVIKSPSLEPYLKRNDSSCSRV
ncbi:uncharacterized protein K02A2.6-like [Microplitis mediator]|uniref:uncharacterized protein K02A2.6-like n=1 Tax=Microplitis mediator TaxID=375433 RepID=UPI0025557C00|nr:uncharacterized protein K02A2.6-like [Microplitis mediator]